jgi:hypothetical protein
VKGRSHGKGHAPWMKASVRETFSLFGAGDLGAKLLCCLGSFDDILGRYSWWASDRRTRDAKAISAGAAIPVCKRFCRRRDGG